MALKQRLTDVENKLMIGGGGMQGRIVGEFGMDMCIMLCLKWIKSYL